MNGQCGESDWRGEMKIQLHLGLGVLLRRKRYLKKGNLFVVQTGASTSESTDDKRTKYVLSEG